MCILMMTDKNKYIDAGVAGTIVFTVILYLIELLSILINSGIAIILNKPVFRREKSSYGYPWVVCLPCRLRFCL